MGTNNRSVPDHERGHDGSPGSDVGRLERERAAEKRQDAALERYRQALRDARGGADEEDAEQVSEEGDKTE